MTDKKCTKCCIDYEETVWKFCPHCGETLECVPLSVSAKECADKVLSMYGENGVPDANRECYKESIALIVQRHINKR